MIYKFLKRPALKKVQIKILNTSKLYGLKILHISDLHISRNSKDEDILYLIEMINNTKFDIALCSGDIVDDKIELIKDKIKLFKNLTKKLYIVSGNHELIWGYKKFLDVIKDIEKFELIDEKALKFHIKEKEFYVCGIGDKYSKFFGRKRDLRFLQTLQTNIPIIFLAHQPNDCKIALKQNASLFLCGHTHGGQIYPFHLLVKVVTKYIAGLYNKNSMCIYVNSGIGTWGIHKRYKSENEIALLEII